MDNIPELQARLAALGELANSKKKEQKELRNRTRLQRELQERLELKVLVLLCMTSGELSAARKLLEQLNKQNEQLNTVILGKVMAEYQGMDDEERKEMVNTSDPVGEKLVRQMKKFYEEHTLHKWIEHQNITKGIAPRTHVVHDHLRKRNADSSGCGASSARKRSQEQWLRRWRRRWDVNLGRVACRETLPESECQTKALVFVFFPVIILSRPSEFLDCT